MGANISKFKIDIMNIIYLVSDLRSAGPTNQAYNLMTGLRKFECKAWIVTLYEEREDSWMDRFIHAGINIHQLHANRKNLFGAVLKLERFIKENQINVLHSSGMSADFVNRLVRSKVLKINTVRQEFSALAEGQSNLMKLFSKFVTLTNHKAMNVRVACSKALQKHLHDYSKGDYECVENGVDIDKYDVVDTIKKKELRNLLGIDDNVLIYISVGVLYTRKQNLALADAFVNCNLDNAILLIVGDGVEMDDLKNISKNNPNIRLIGKVLDPLPYYHCADIFVSASLAEGLPNTVMEAMACGLPCILSDIGPHKEILEYGPKAGTLFRTGDYQQLEQEFKNSQTWDLITKSEYAHRLVNENLSKYCTAKKYYDLYAKNSYE